MLMLPLLLEHEVDAAVVHDGEVVGRGEVILRAEGAGSVAPQALGQVD